MKLAVGLQIALQAVARNLLRSLLAMVGLIIGVAAVLTMVALGRGAQESVTDEVSSAGTNLVFVRAGNYTRGGDAVNIPSGFGKATTLTAEDAAFASRIDGVASLTPEVDDRASMTSEGGRFFGTLLGRGPGVIDVYELELDQGRALVDQDVSTAATVAVLGRTAAESLFPGGIDLDDAEIEIGGEQYRVIGVLRDKDPTFDERALVPYTTLQEALGVDYLSAFTLKTEQAGGASDVAEAVRALLRDRHGLDEPGRDEDLPTPTGEFAMEGTGQVPDDFTVRTQAAQALTQGLYTTAAAFVLASMPRLDEVSSEEMVNTLTRANSTMTVLLASIAAVSLVVGGIGIMNIMLLAVTERTMEVGLRLSVGARRRDVLAQFLMEAVLISLSGGLVGVVAGYASAFVLTRFLAWPTYVSPEAVLMGFGLAFGVGVTFGYYPALRASRLDPIDALRYE